MQRVTAVAVMGAALLCACGGQAAPPKAAPPPREVETLTLKPEKVRETGEYVGTIVSRQTVSVLPQVAGYVRKIHVLPGQKVEAGAPLLDVDARQENAALQSAQAQATSAQSSLELAKQTLARTEQLYREGLVSAQELERTRAAADAAQAQARSAGAAVSQRQVQLQFYSVKAPFAGTVGDVTVRVGDFVSPTTPLTSVAQADALEVNIAVPAFRARGLEVETPVELLDREGRVLLTAPVYFVAPQADPRTQLVDVKAAFRNTVGLRPSELVRARIIYRTVEALQVPALAVIRQSGQPFVYLVSEENGAAKVERKPISLGALGETAFVVQGGLKQGDRIAVSSLQMLRDGAPVKPVPPPSRAASAEPDSPRVTSGAGGPR